MDGELGSDGVRVVVEEGYILVTLKGLLFWMCGGKFQPRSEYQHFLWQRDLE